MPDQHNEAQKPKPGDLPPSPMSEETASLLGLIDRLSSLIERSDLIELEVESGDTGIVLRKPAALMPQAVGGAAASPAGDGSAASAGAGTTGEPSVPVTPVKAIKAPLTGVYYGAPSPGAPPYVTPGQQVTVGQVIGLIEAMKLFNEIKSDISGRVIRLVAETGKLVKAKQPLIEVEP